MRFDTLRLMLRNNGGDYVDFYTIERRWWFWPFWTQIHTFTDSRGAATKYESIRKGIKKKARSSVISIS